MENATKALLISAGVLFGIIVLTAVIFGFTQISNYYKNKEEMVLSEQIIKFNKQYTTYIKDDVRGTDILSLVNRIVDYNKREADVDGIKFERIKIEIKFDGRISEFKYTPPKGYKGKNDTIINDLDNKNNDNELLRISNKVKEIKSNTGVEFSEEQLQRCTAEISNIFAPDDFKSSEIGSPNYDLAVQKRNSVVSSIIGKNYDDLFNNDDGQKKENAFKQAILEYYQYQRFKRAHFDCETSKVEYNKGTGRIVKLVFKFNGKFE